MLRQHRLSTHDFDMLGAGFGSAETVASLRAAQFSQRLIGLRAVLDAADRAGYSYAPGLAAGWELLKTTHQHDVAATVSVLGYPFVGAWVGHCLRLLGNPSRETAARELGYLGCVAAAAAVRAAVPFSIEVPVWEGVVCLPTLGRMAVPDARTISVRSDGCETLIGEMPLGRGTAWQELRRLTWESGGRPFPWPWTTSIPTARRLGCHWHLGCLMRPSPHGGEASGMHGNCWSVTTPIMLRRSGLFWPRSCHWP